MKLGEAESTRLLSLGAGELAAGPVAGALGNAIAAALGLRARHLPFAPERLLALVHSGGE